MAVDATEVAEVTASPDAPAAAATTQEPAVAAEAPPAEEKAPDPSPADDVWARVLDLDPEELIRRNPRLQGKLGALAQQQGDRRYQEATTAYQRQLAEIRETEAKATRRAELQRLAVDDPQELARKVTTDIATEQYQESQAALLARQQADMDDRLARQLDGVYANPEVRAIWDQADPETQQKLNWRNHNTIPDFFNYLNDLVADHRADAKATSKAEKLAQARFDALVKEGQVEAIKAAADGGADLNLDSGQGAEHIFTVAEIERLSPTDFSKHKAAINSQYAAGLIR